MNIAIWILAGAALGWAACSLLKINASRGLVLSIIIGAVGGFAGGNVLAPMLGSVVETPNEFSLLSTLVALASAAVCLLVSDQLHHRFKV